MALIRASNAPLLNGKERSYLVASPAAGDSTVTVADYAQFTVNNYVLIGDFGQEGSEIIKLHASTVPTSAGVVTFSSNLVYPHSVNDPIVQIDFNQVEFSRATTTTGSKSVLATSNIEADDLFTAYNDIINSTGYGFVRYKNSATTTYSSYSGPIPYAGFERSSVRKIKDAALSLTNEAISDLITDDFLLQELNNWQDDVTRQKDWAFELESALDTVIAGAKTYSLPTTPYSLKYEDSNKAILNVRLKQQYPLQYIDKTMYEEAMFDKVSSPLATAVSSTSDTTVVLDDTSDFPSSGTATFGDGTGDSFDYTGNDTSTNTLSGVTGLSTTHDIDATVWSSQSLSQPTSYTIYNGEFYLYPVASDTYDGVSLYYDYWKKIPELTQDTDTTIIPFYGIAQYYLAWKIEAKKRNRDQADYWRQIYESRLSGEMRRNRDTQNKSFKVWTPWTKRYR